MANQAATFKRDTIRFYTPEGLRVDIKLEFYRGKWNLVTKGLAGEQRIVSVNGYGLKATEVISYNNTVLSETGAQDFGFFGVHKWQFAGVFAQVIKVRSLSAIGDIIQGRDGKSGLKSVFMADVYKEARKELKKVLTSKPKQTLSQVTSDTLEPTPQKD